MAVHGTMGITRLVGCRRLAHEEHAGGRGTAGTDGYEGLAWGRDVQRSRVLEVERARGMLQLERWRVTWCYKELVFSGAKD